ncbi:MAG: hypothetical protein L7W95_11640, partial [Alphaproteobacteria bacterium]|nr:hypothetical protein [Alphaproteobacteria bacterium]
GPRNEHLRVPEGAIFHDKINNITVFADVNHTINTKTRNLVTSKVLKTTILLIKHEEQSKDWQ